MQDEGWEDHIFQTILKSGIIGERDLYNLYRKTYLIAVAL